MTRDGTVPSRPGRRRGLLGACAAFMALPACAAEREAPVIRAPAGEIAGQAADGVNAFKGIPYAEAPVGELRWKPAVRLPAFEAPLSADAFGPACIQPDRADDSSIYADAPQAMDEDCLTLNVWAPENAEGAPVMVWIHGGALRAGASSQGIYDGTALAREGIVVVSINYRLGVLGFMAHPELNAESEDGVSGNYGLLDQIAALQWVEDNIEAFGGDADNVTVAGESAGAFSIMYLMASPTARGLFDRAILQSAYMISVPALKEERAGQPAAETSGLAVAEALGAEGIAALRTMDAAELSDAAAASGYAPWTVVDGKHVPAQLVEIFDRGEQAQVTVIAGFNSGEIRSMRGLAPPVPESAEAYEATIRARYGDLADEFLRLYPADDLEDSIVATTRDALYGWTAQRLAEKQTQIGQPAYLYLFDHGYPAAEALGLHGFHAAELPFMFGTTDRTPPQWPEIPDTEAEEDLSEAMVSYWASFTADGRPRAEGAPDWKPYGEDGAYMLFGEEPQMRTGLMPGMFALHEEAVCRRRSSGTQGWNWNTGLWSPVLSQGDADCS